MLECRASNSLDRGGEYDIGYQERWHECAFHTVVSAS